jgi:hypothetical protein
MIPNGWMILTRLAAIFGICGIMFGMLSPHYGAILIAGALLFGASLIASGIHTKS